MTHPILHLLIPVIVLRLLKVDKKLVFFLSPLALLPDLDIITPLHRILFHNLLFVLIIPLIVTLLVKKFFPSQHSSKKIYLISFLMLSLHLMLDLAGGTAYLYPLSSQRYAIIGTMSLIPSEISNYTINYILFQIIGINIIYIFMFINTFSINSLEVIKNKLTKSSYFFFINNKIKK